MHLALIDSYQGHALDVVMHHTKSKYKSTIVKALGTNMLLMCSE
jgi:hypothetical protein